MNRDIFDITIIGGSFAGMSAALALAAISPDLKIAVIEKQDIVNHDRKPDGRGYAISNSSLRLFGEIGVCDQVLQEAGAIKDIRITDYKSAAVLDFLSKEADEKNFGALIESYIIHNALRDKLIATANIKLFCPHSYQDILFLQNKVLVKLNDEVALESKLLLACDGRFSPLRKLFNIHTTEKNYQQKAIVFNIKHQKPHEDIAYEKFLPGGPLAILPLKNQHHSSIVWIAPNKDAEAILELDEQNFAHQLHKKMENCLGEIEVVSEKFSYPLIMIEAQKFYHEKMLLVGDAACGVHPIAGQGLNLGLGSIKILQELVRQYLFAGLDIASSSLIESYNKKARSKAKKMVMATDILNSLFETKSLTIGLARDFGLAMVNKIPRLKKIFIKNAGGA
jgi:2-octaprenyl-6-methoxyphenol hydroxylase